MKKILALLAFAAITISSYAQSINKIEGDTVKLQARLGNKTVVDIVGRTQISGTVKPGADTAFYKYGLVIVNGRLMVGNGSYFADVSPSNFAWANITGKPSNFTTTYALSNDIPDSIQARLKTTIATALLAAKLDTSKAHSDSIALAKAINNKVSKYQDWVSVFKVKDSATGKESFLVTPATKIVKIGDYLKTTNGTYIVVDDSNGFIDLNAKNGFINVETAGGFGNIVGGTWLIGNDGTATFINTLYKSDTTYTGNGKVLTQWKGLQLVNSEAATRAASDIVLQTNINTEAAIARAAEALKLNKSDTAAMLILYKDAINQRLKLSDTLAMLYNYKLAINARLKYSDSLIYQSKFGSDSARKNIYGLLSNKVSKWENWNTNLYVQGRLQVDGQAFARSISNGPDADTWSINIDGSAYLSDGNAVINADGSARFGAGTTNIYANGSAAFAYGAFFITSGGDLYVENVRTESLSNNDYSGTWYIGGDGSAYFNEIHSSDNISADNFNAASGYFTSNSSINSDGSASFAGGAILINADGSATFGNQSTNINPDGGISADILSVNEVHSPYANIQNIEAFEISVMNANIEGLSVSEMFSNNSIINNLTTSLIKTAVLKYKSVDPGDPDVIWALRTPSTYNDDVFMSLSNVEINIFGGTLIGFQGANNLPRSSAYDAQYITTTVAPSSSTSTGIKGEVRFTGAFRYECIATNSWVKSSVTTF